MTYVEFFRERQEARYAIGKGRFRACCWSYAAGRRTRLSSGSSARWTGSVHLSRLRGRSPHSPSAAGGGLLWKLRGVRS